MTKKDYELIADSLENSYLGLMMFPKNTEQFYHEIVERLSNYLTCDNPRFNREKFEKACGLKITGKI